MDDPSHQFRNDLSSSSVQKQASSTYDLHRKSSCYLTDAGSQRMNLKYASGNRHAGMSEFEHFNNGGDADRTLFGETSHMGRTDGEVYRHKMSNNICCPLSPPAPPNAKRSNSPPLNACHHSKSPPNLNYARQISPPNYRPQSPPQTDLPHQNESTNIIYSRKMAPCHGNYRAHSPPKSNYRPTSNIRPLSPPKTNYRSLSPLCATYPTRLRYSRPISSSKAHYRDKSPPNVSYSERIPSPRTSYQSRSPVRTNAERHSPRNKNYSRATSPPTTNHRSKSPPKPYQSRAKSPPVESYGPPGSPPPLKSEYRHRQMSPIRNMCQLHPRVQGPPVGQATKDELESTANDKRNFDTDSLLGGLAESVDSEKTRKTSSTTIRRSAHDLRKVVKTQCKIRDVIDKTIKQMAEDVSSDADDAFNRRMKEKELEYKQQVKKHMAELYNLEKNSSDTMLHAKPPLVEKSSQTCGFKQDWGTPKNEKNSSKSDGEDMDHVLYIGDKFKVTMGDVVNSRVVNPMIMKIQKMQINNLRGEMSLMEDLERLPSRVDEYYNASVKDRQSKTGREHTEDKEEQKRNEWAGKQRQ